jgi:very-short-patch-repair endonuclease
VDSRDYHYDVDDWEHTMRRDARMTAVGIRVLHFSPRQIRTSPAEVAETIRMALRSGGPLPGLRAVPAGSR